MPEPDSEILFRRIRDIALRKPHHSKRYIKFVMDKSNVQDGTFHHVCGSVHGLKSTDLLGVAVNGKEHLEGEQNHDWIVEQLPKAIENLLEYVRLSETGQLTQSLFRSQDLELWHSSHKAMITFDSATEEYVIHKVTGNRIGAETGRSMDEELAIRLMLKEIEEVKSTYLRKHSSPKGEK